MIMIPFILGFPYIHVPPVGWGRMSLFYKVPRILEISLKPFDISLILGMCYLNRLGVGGAWYMYRKGVAGIQMLRRNPKQLRGRKFANCRTEASTVAYPCEPITLGG